VGLRGFIIDITEQKQSEDSLRSLSARLITTQEEERSRIARELHDDFNQRLAILAMDIERLGGQQPASRKDFSDGIETLLQRTKELSSDVHRLSHQLHPSILQHLGLVVAIRSFCQEISEQHGIRVELVHHGAPRSLPDDVALCLYRIVQEALRNVIKHSGADSARVEFSGTTEELTLKISDDGTGFDSESAQTHKGLGLLSMRERLRLVGGTIAIERVEPAGTRIDVRIPFPDSDRQ
jgi:signal transduction histidine kinase